MFLDKREKQHFNLIRPTNCLINTIPLRDVSGVSNLYKSLHKKITILFKISIQKWYEKAETSL